MQTQGLPVTLSNFHTLALRSINDFIILNNQKSKKLTFMLFKLVLEFHNNTIGLVIATNVDNREYWQVLG